MFDWIRKFAIFLVGFTLPIQGYAVDVGGIPMTATRIVAAFLLVIGLIQFLLTGRRWPRNSKNLWVFAFLVSYTVACSTGLLIRVPLSNVLILLSTLVSLVIYYFLVTYVVLSRNDLALLLWAVVLGSVFTAAPAFLGAEVQQELSTVERYEGLAGQSNSLAFDMAVALPVAMALFFATRSPFRKAILLGGAAVAAIGMLLALSRGAFVSVAAMWAFWVYRSGRLDTIKYVVPAVIAVFALVYAAPESVTERIETMTDPAKRAADGSIQSRFAVGEIAVKAFLHHPLIGTGRFGFNVWAAGQEGGWVVGDATIHSAYLGVAAYQGVGGLLPFGMMLFLTWRDYNRVRLVPGSHGGRRDPILTEYKHYSVFLQIAFLGNLIGSLFGTTLTSKSQWLVLSLSTVLVALTSARLRELQAQAPAPEAPAQRLEAGGYGLAGRPADAGAR